MMTDEENAIVDKDHNSTQAKYAKAEQFIKNAKKEAHIKKAMLLQEGRE